MSRTPINPVSLYESLPFGFSHAITHRRERLIHLAGQVAWDRNCNIVGLGDILTQTKQVLKNLKEVLTAAGAAPADLVRLRTYVVHHSPALLEPICKEITAFYGDVPPAPNTFIGVQALALPDFLIEIEADAAVNDGV